MAMRLGELRRTMTATVATVEPRVLSVAAGDAEAGRGRMAGIQVDHTADWVTTRHTVLGELQRLCDHHHDLETHHGWAAIRAPESTVLMVSPDDPLHPSRARRGPPVTGR